MDPSANVSTWTKPRGHATGKLIPYQGRRSGQSDLRRVTIVPPNHRHVDSGAHSVAPPPPTSSKPGPVTAPAWLASFRRRLIITDVVVVVVAVFLGQQAAAMGMVPVGVGGTVGDWLLSTLLIGAWLISLGIERVWDIGVIGAGPSEYRRIFTASLVLAAVIGIVAYLTLAPTARGYLLIAIPGGTAGLVVGHWVWRKMLRANQRSARHLRTLIVVGQRTDVEGLCEIVRESPMAGYGVIAVCIHGEQIAGNAAIDQFQDLVVINKISDVATVAMELGAGAVALAGPQEFTAEHLSDLSLRLQRTGVQVFVTTEVNYPAGARIHLSPVAGLPLMRVGEPRFRGWRAAVKRTIDITVSALGLVVLSPLILIGAVAVLLADGVPIFHDRELVGRGGRQFRVWTLRCTPLGVKARMVEVNGQFVVVAGALPVNAGAVAAAGAAPLTAARSSERPGRLGARNGTANGSVSAGSTQLSFELPMGWDDPVQPASAPPCPPVILESGTAPVSYELEPTKVGRVLRRVGIDESPALLSVFFGQMSLVGPQARAAGSAAPGATLRGRPGLTGSWRVGHRQDETAQDRSRSDFYYVETWSVASDIVTIAKTVKLVLSGADRQH